MDEDAAVTRIALGNAKAPWIIFDADNPPWAVEHLYDTTRVKMCEYLSTKGIDPSPPRTHTRDRGTISSMRRTATQPVASPASSKTRCSIWRRTHIPETSATYVA